jgi:hypothetical protein
MMVNFQFVIGGKGMDVSSLMLPQLLSSSSCCPLRSPGASLRLVFSVMLTVVMAATV